MTPAIRDKHMTAHQDLEDLLARAIEAEHHARATGADAMQAVYMDQIRQLRQAILLQGNGDLERAVKQVTKEEK